MVSPISFPATMIGNDSEVVGGGVGIKGTLQQRQLARALRRLREEAGLSLEEAAPKLDWSTSKLGRIETTQQGARTPPDRSSRSRPPSGAPSSAASGPVTSADPPHSDQLCARRVRHLSFLGDFRQRCCRTRRRKSGGVF
ncbi:MAG: helix-turn-helix domain-containing protein [Pseudonocardiaceae bacterium]